MNIEHGFSALLGIVGLTLSAGCVGGVDERGAPTTENIGEIDEALQGIGRINIYGQAKCWPVPGILTLVACGSGAIYNLDDGRLYGTDTYYRFYTGSSCLTANANGTVTFSYCNIANNALPDDNQRWMGIYNPSLDAYQLKNKLYTAYLRSSPYSSTLELFPTSNPNDASQLWQNAKY